MRTTNDGKTAKFPLIDLRQLDCLAKTSFGAIEGCFSKHLPDESSECFAIIATHDCSISGMLIEKEPYLEVMFAKIIEKPEGNLTLGKNPRRLHVQMENNKNSQWIEINICHREFLPKAAFDGQKKIAEYSFSEENKGLIRRWLAARYQAPAYPNAYEARLKINKNDQRIEKILARVGKNAIDGLFMILSPDKEELENDQPYELELMLLVKSDISDEEMRQIEQIRNDLVKILRGIRGNGIHLVGDNETLTEEQVRSLIPIRLDSEITVSEYRQYDKMRLDYLSEGQDAEQPVQRPLNQ